MSEIPDSLFESYEATIVGDWLVKVSKYHGQIQVFMFSLMTGETSIQWFDSEYDAIFYVDYMSMKYV